MRHFFLRKGHCYSVPAAMSSLLSDYLEASSLHGLKYLSESKSLLFKLVWFVSISTSFSAAVYIIYSNIVQWENNPSVITKVMPILVEVHVPIRPTFFVHFAKVCVLQNSDIDMPTITICPREPDFRNLLANYFNRYYDHAKHPDLDQEILRYGTRGLLLGRVLDTFAYYEINLFGKTDKPYPFKHCETVANASLAEPHCRFLQLLYALYGADARCPNHMTSRYEKRSETKSFSFVLGYLTEKILSRERPTEEDLAAEIEKTCEISVEGYQEVLLDTDQIPVQWKELSFIYSLFFPLVGRNNLTGSFDLLPVRTLDQFELPPEIKVESLDRMGDLFSHLMNVNQVGKIRYDSGYVDYLSIEQYMDPVKTEILNMAGKRLYFEIRERFGLDDNRDMVNLLAYFEPRLAGREANVGLSNSCNGSCEGDLGDESCRSYCKLIENKDQFEGFLVEVMWMMNSLSVNGPHVDGPRSLLLSGLLEGKGEIVPWNEVVTDRGICYTSYSKGRLNQLQYKGSKSCHFVFVLQTILLKLARRAGTTLSSIFWTH